MSNRWQLQDAKNRFSELVEKAQRSPQVVTRRGIEAAVVLSFAEYQKLMRKGRRSLVDVLLSAPKVRGGLDVERSTDTARDVDLE
jgi:prevent-host-death family protein